MLEDPNRLNRVLMNILSNAVKYTPTGGHIRFEVDELPRNEHYARYLSLIHIWSVLSVLLHSFSFLRPAAKALAT